METRICEKHGQYEVKTVVVMGRPFSNICPECEKEQSAREEAENKERLEKAKFQEMTARGIEPEFYDATLEQYKPENESERAAKQACEDLVDGKIKKLMLLGTNGTGKTLLATALALQLNGIRTTMYELSARIRSGYNNGESELVVLNRLLSYNFICIDEVGRTKGSDAERNWLSYLIDKAHTRNIRLMIISNRQTARNLPADRRGEAIEFFFDNDVISRLRQDARIVEVKGRDRRATVTVAV